MSSDSMRSDYDVVIAGGGLVGGSLALALAQLSCRTALVEAVLPDSESQPSFDDRTIALSYGSCRILSALGLWEYLQQQDSIWAIHKIHVSEQKRFGTALIDSAEQGVPQLGYVIKSRDLGAAIWQRLRDLNNVDLFCPGTVTATDCSPHARSIDLDSAANPAALAAKLLVVADGARSRLRDALQISAEHRDYEQVAIVANIQVDKRKAGHVAYERFTAAGPIAMLPGPQGQYTVVMARRAEAAPQVLDLSSDDFLSLAQDDFGYRLGRLSRVGNRSSYPLGLTTADALSAERAVLIGNAAHGLHPVAAQGFNLGLRDVACLAELIADGCAEQGAGFDPGAANLLASYKAWRGDDQRKVVRFTDSLIRGFGAEDPGLAVGRGLALASFDMLPGAKRMLAHQTMGLSGHLSRLARGMPL
jgi:2-octaprenyl-6-methoxyphenol hydroxylase